jgi:hypothetical protein
VCGFVTPRHPETREQDMGLCPKFDFSRNKVCMSNKWIAGELPHVPACNMCDGVGSVVNANQVTTCFRCGGSKKEKY